MPITFVKYSRLVNLGNYENERFEAGVNLAEGQTPAMGMDEARTFVSAQQETLNQERKRLAELDSLEHQSESLQHRIAQQKRVLESLDEARERLVAMLGLHGVHVEIPRWADSAVMLSIAALEAQGAAADAATPEDGAPDDDDEGDEDGEDDEDDEDDEDS